MTQDCLLTTCVFIFQGSTGPAGPPGFPGGAGAKVSHLELEILLISHQNRLFNWLNFMQIKCGVVIPPCFTTSHLTVIILLCTILWCAL